MDPIFLGTSSRTPTRDRNVTSVALRRAGDWDLFDCGEGTQHRVLATSLSLSRLRRVFISHLHGDHCFGLFGLLGSRAMAGASGKVDAIELDHRVTSLGWCLRETPRPGVFDAARALELGVPKGSAFGRLQQGESVTLTDGQVIEPSSVVGASRPGRTVIIAGDNRDPMRPRNGDSASLTPSGGA